MLKKWILLVIVVLLISHGMYKIYQYYQPSKFTNEEGRVINIEGTIIDIPHVNNRATNFVFKTKQGCIKLNWYQTNAQLAPGQYWQLSIKLKPLNYLGNPGEFDYSNYLRIEGINAVGYVINSKDNHLIEFHWYDDPLDQLRFYYYQKVLSATAGLKTQAILIALILGDKSLLTSTDWTSFERTGTSYFMVISGLHIVLFAMLGGTIARYLWSAIPRCALWIPAPQIGLGVGLILGILYGMMAGALVPTQRAVLMLLFVGIAKLCLRRISSMHALIISFMFIVIWNPLVIFSVAFWLSFIAVFFLIFCFSGRMGKLKWWQEWIIPQWLMFWALLPIMVYTFNQLSIISIITNFLAMPVMMLGVIPTALLGMLLLLFLPKLGILCFKLSNFIMTELLLGLHYFAFQSWWGSWVAQISFANMLMGLIGAFIVFLPKALPYRWMGWFMLIPILCPIPEKIAQGTINQVELKTQNGIATLIKTKNHVILEQNVSDVRCAHGDLRHIIEPYLVHEGINNIDLWVINTGGNYHTILNLQQDLAKINIHSIANNHKFKIYDSHLQSCSKESTWVWDGVKFTLNQDQKNKLCQLSNIPA